MAFVKVCTVDDLGFDGMAGFYMEGVEVLVVRDKQGVIRAFDGICPHQDSLLAEGSFDGAAIICPTHGWMFDAITGKGINPSSCHISPYPVKLEGEDILVDTDGDPPPES
jgi:toluene monooxygenase system ferredoxin subunit